MSSDSPLVVEFLGLFWALCERLNNDPASIAQMAHDDAEFKGHCIKMHNSHSVLERVSQQRRRSFAAPINPSFVRAWREYEGKYRAHIHSVYIADIDLGDSWRGQALPATRPLFESKFEEADEQGQRLEASISSAVEFLQDALESNEFLSREQALTVRDGLDALDSLTKTIGLDVQGVFRRRQLLSLVLVPRHVARGHGSAERMSLYTYLGEAQDAFVRGTPYAALIMLRAIVELVLTRHYGAEERQLESKINGCKALPPAVNRERLMRLKDLADSVVHERDEQNKLAKDGRIKSDVRSLSKIGLEKEIISCLWLVQALIEEAPE